MKSLILPCITFLIVLIIWGAFFLFTQESSEVLVSFMEDVYSYAEIKNWEEAVNSNEDFLNEWDKNEKIYSFFIENTSLHDVRLSAERCMGYINAKDHALTMGESASIINHLELLKRNDTIEMGNLF